MPDITTMILVGIAVAAGILMADWAQSHTRHSPAQVEVQREPQSVDDYVMLHYGTKAY